MGTGIYIGVNNAAKKVSNGYIGINGTAKKIVKGYIGDANGKPKLFYTSDNLPPKASLNSMSWADIKTVVDAGKASEYWSVGDAKYVTLNGTVGRTTISGTYACFIIGFDHNWYLEGKGMHMQFARINGVGHDIAFADNKYALDMAERSGYFSMNRYRDNSNGWKNSLMRTTICSDFYDILPNDLQSVITPCTKYTDNSTSYQNELPEMTITNAHNYMTKTSDNIFLLSEVEIFGGNAEIGNPCERYYQDMYAYYANGESTIRATHLDRHNPEAFWWTRTRAINVNEEDDMMCFVHVNDSGLPSYDYATRSYGFAPAFKI